MSLMPSFSRPLIGVDFGARQIKAVQAARSRGGAPLSACLTRRAVGGAPDGAEVARLTEVLMRQGFQGRSVALTAPVDRLMSLVLDMPPRDSGAPYDVIASQEFARQQQLTAGSFELAWWDVPRPVRSNSSKVMAVGCTHADSEPLLDAFERGGFDVALVDSGQCASVRACRSQLGPAMGVSAVLDMGWGTSRLALVYRDAIVFERVFSGSGLSGLSEKVCSAMSIDVNEAGVLLERLGIADGQAEVSTGDARVSSVSQELRPYVEAWLDEIAEAVEASFGYTAHLYPDAAVGRLVLVGGGACVPGVASYLDGRVGPEVVAFGGEDGMPHAALMASAMGLSGCGEQRRAA